MRPSSRLKLTIVFSLLLIFIVGLALRGFIHTPTHAANAARTAGSVPCGAWSVISSPSPGPFNNSLFGVAAIAKNNVWAVGYAEVLHALIEHWNGTTWSVVSSPSPGTGSNILSGIAALSANNIWAVGSTNNNGSGYEQTLIEHWNGISWSIIQSPNVGQGDNGLSGVAAVSTSDIFAVGSAMASSNSLNQTLIEHWDGSSWSIVSSPNVTNSSNGFSAITSVSSSNVWAVGTSSSASSSSTSSTLIEHWDGVTWNIVPSPNPAPFSILQGTTHVPGTNNIWTVGLYHGFSTFTI